MYTFMEKFQVQIVVLLCAVGLCGTSFTRVAQASASSSLEMELPLEILVYQETGVASLKKMTMRKAPGVITLVTEEEIRRAGARDLMDVLNLVQGFQFGVDVLNVSGLFFRGMWGQDGKISLRWDGREINEILYSCLGFGNRFPVDQIQRVEIIRGPGSPIYGGNAELGVINIITKSAEDYDGAEISAIYGQMPKTYGRRDLSVAYGKKFSEDFSLTGSAFLGQGHRSDLNYTNYDGTTFDMTRSFQLDPLNVNLRGQYQGLNLHFMAERYHTTDMEFISPEEFLLEDEDFTNYFADAVYNWQVGEDLLLIPHVNYKYQRPWEETPTDSAYDVDYLFKKTVQRLTGELTAIYDVTESLNLLGGVEYQKDRADNLLDETYYNGGTGISEFSNLASFVQMIWESPWFDMTAGARYENHSVYGSSFVPRLALTREFSDWHLKLLANKAFRAPSLDSIILNPDIKPETSTALEVEAGYRWHGHMVTVNLFDITMDNPIVYSMDPQTGLEEDYYNFPANRTRGGEVDYRSQASWGSYKVGYSYYQTVQNSVSLFSVPERSDLMVGSAAHKATVSASFNLTSHLSVNPSAIYLSERFGARALDEFDEPVVERFEPVLMVNLYLYWKHFLLPQLDAGLGIYNMLNSRHDLIQPAASGVPLPGPSREIIVKANYRF